MPFLTFVLPFFSPRQWHALVLPILLVAVTLVRAEEGGTLEAWGAIRGGRLLTEPLAVLTYALPHTHWGFALGNGVGLAVGLTMASRTIGARAAWGGLLLGTVVAGLHLSWTLRSDMAVVGASPAVFVALGLASVAWLRMREEITYPRRVDRLAGFATLFLTSAAMATPFLLEAAQGTLSNFTPEEFGTFVLRRIQPVHLTGLAVGALWGALLPRSW